MNSKAARVFASRATRCSFSSVFHLRSASSDPALIERAKEIEALFTRAVVLPIGLFGVAVGLFKGVEYLKYKI